ncbi:MAG: tRNA-dihydrouridine synthase [Pseudomonadota bacterium]
MLAPMEGVTDQSMRRILTGIGGYDRCVTEFLRVTDHLYPQRVFTKNCPELANDGFTDAGIPVYLQLLGSHPQAMADNAAKAAAMGASGIDINFGCPAKTVNRHGGGSALLRTPHTVAEIVARVRDAVPVRIPVTAKIRLGYEHADNVLDIASRIEQAGAAELCVHARTKVDGYKPPAHWHLVRQVTDQLTIPVIINGEIWSLENAKQAAMASGCNDVMLGRSALANPRLALFIAQQTQAPDADALLPWQQVIDLLLALLHSGRHLPEKYVGNRTKQWLTYLRLVYPQAQSTFEQIKRLRSCDEISTRLKDADMQCTANPGLH